jgi:phosphoribosylglycinamide formyltransferase-1
MYHLPTVPFSRPLKLAVLISGGGTTLDNFLSHIEAGELPAEVVLVIASRKNCRGVEKARNYGLNTQVIRPQDFDSPDDFGAAVFGACRAEQVDLVTLAGFLSFLPIADDFLGRVMNIHPSLIPAFCGAGYYGGKVHQAVFERGVKVTGCTVHFADNQYDHGPIIVQRTVAVQGADTPDSIANKVFEQECLAYPEAIRLYAAAGLRIEQGRVWCSQETGST